MPGRGTLGDGGVVVVHCVLQLCDPDVESVAQLSLLPFEGAPRLVARVMWVQHVGRVGEIDPVVLQVRSERLQGGLWVVSEGEDVEKSGGLGVG